MLPFSVMIRDGIETDIELCLALDTRYETDSAWQMTFLQQGNGWEITFRTERLPRTIETPYAVTRQRLEEALEQHNLFVALNKETLAPCGYATTRYDALNQAGVLRDVVVAYPFRRHGIGTRLLTVARRWAQEKQARFFLAETQTRNVPAIQFCQRQGLAFCGFNDKLFENHEIAVYFGQALR